jgi:UDP-N-acetylmuramoylalanine--D-glutamate ligase
MIPAELLDSKKILILGYGREGRCAHRYIAKNYPNASIAIADRAETLNDIPTDCTIEALYTGSTYLSCAHQYEVVIPSPGIALRSLAHNTFSSQVCFLSPTELFFCEARRRYPHAKLIGITGTKGKSTTTSLIGAILKNHYNDVRLAGNIGLPMLDYLDGASNETVFVLELSSFQLELLSQSPDIAVLLGIVPEHLDHHGSYEAYRTAKEHITLFQNAQDTLIIDPTLESLREIPTKTKARIAPYALEERAEARCYLRDGTVMIREGSVAIPCIKTSELSVRGEGNIRNVLAAVTCGLVLSCTPTEIAAALRSFSPLPHRLEDIGTFCGIRFINDSLATIPQALGNALSAFGAEAKTLIAGGYDRGLDFTPIAPLIASSHLETLILFPTTGAHIKKAVLAHEPHTVRKFYEATSMEHAVALAFEHTPPGATCIMSPASSSFNMFRDYKDRGDSFKRAVEHHAQQNSPSPSTL